MSQLIQIADFQFIVLKDNINITEQDRKKYASMPLNNEYFGSRVVDVPTSLALLAEFDKCPFANGDFINDLDQETPTITKTDDYVYIGPMYSVPSARIPLLLQKAGLKIKRTKHIAYLAPGKTPEDPYTLVNQDGTPFETPGRNSEGRANKLDIDIYDDVLALRPDEYERYLRAKKLIESGKSSEVNNQDLDLWALTETFIIRREKLDVVFHEMKHAQNSLILFDYLFNHPDCKLSGIDIFKCDQDNELSAKLAEAIEAINTYNQSENKGDLSVFERSILQQLLEGKSIQDRKRLLSDIPYAVHEICMYWYKNYAKNYRPQFVQNTTIGLKQIPLKHLAYESDGTSYSDIRKLMFTYNVYDVRTGKYVTMDLSEYVIDTGISKSDLQMTQQMYKDIVIKRQQVLEERAGKVQRDLMNEAQEKYKELVDETEYRKALADLQSKGMDYLTALNFMQEMTDATEHTDSVESQTKEGKKQFRNILKNAIHGIRQKFPLKRFRKTKNDGIDYE